MEHDKAGVQAKVEQPVRVIKHQFGLAQVRFKGLPKDMASRLAPFALPNMSTARGHLMA
jgi:IS5 family transposase